MPDQRNNVLLPCALPCTKSLRVAVAAIIRDIQRDQHETDQCTADRLGISVGTVRNARNETADLGALTIAKIGALYGAQSIDPYNALYGARAEAINFIRCDPLPDLARAIATICDMRRADSPGGSIETPKEKLDALPELKAAGKALIAYIASIEAMRLAA